MKFTILPNMEERKKQWKNYKKGRNAKKERLQEKKNSRYLKRKSFFGIWILRFLIVLLIVGACEAGYIKYDYENAKQDAVDEIEFRNSWTVGYVQNYYNKWLNNGYSRDEIIERLSALTYSVLPMSSNGFDGIECEGVFYTSDGIKLSDSESMTYLFCDLSYTGDYGNTFEPVFKVYQSDTELPSDFLRYIDEYMFGSSETRKTYFESFYIKGDYFYFGKVFFYDGNDLAASYDFTPADTEGMTVVTSTQQFESSIDANLDNAAVKYLGDDGVLHTDKLDSGTMYRVYYYPAIGTYCYEELLAKAENMYMSADEGDLSRSSEDEEPFGMTRTYYVKEGVDDGTEIILSMAYHYNYLTTNKGYVIQIALAGLILTIVISLLWSRNLYVRLRARYELEDYQQNLTRAMAHDLKSPLMIISGMAENLKEQVHTEKRDYYADEIIKNVADMNRMIEQSLGFLKLRQHSKTFEKTDVDMNKITVSLIRKYKELYTDRQMEMSAEGEGTLFGNEALLLKLADNLIQNAVIHGDCGGFVKITLDKKSYTVTNEYHGKLTNADIPRLTAAYEKDDSRKRTGGHGLGLSIVSEIVKLHGGKLNIEIADGMFKVNIVI